MVYTRKGNFSKKFKKKLLNINNKNCVTHFSKNRYKKSKRMKLNRKTRKIKGGAFFTDNTKAMLSRMTNICTSTMSNISQIESAYDLVKKRVLKENLLQKNLKLEATFRSNRLNLSDIKEKRSIYFTNSDECRDFNNSDEYRVVTRVFKSKVDKILSGTLQTISEEEERQLLNLIIKLKEQKEIYKKLNYDVHTHKYTLIRTAEHCIYYFETLVNYFKHTKIIKPLREDISKIEAELTEVRTRIKSKIGRLNYISRMILHRLIKLISVTILSLFHNCIYNCSFDERSWLGYLLKSLKYKLFIGGDEYKKLANTTPSMDDLSTTIETASAQVVDAINNNSELKHKISSLVTMTSSQNTKDDVDDDDETKDQGTNSKFEDIGGGHESKSLDVTDPPVVEVVEGIVSVVPEKLRRATEYLTRATDYYNADKAELEALRGSGIDNVDSLILSIDDHLVLIETFEDYILKNLAYYKLIRFVFLVFGILLIIIGSAVSLFSPPSRLIIIIGLTLILISKENPENIFKNYPSIQLTLQNALKTGGEFSINVIKIIVIGPFYVLGKFGEGFIYILSGLAQIIAAFGD